MMSEELIFVSHVTIFLFAEIDLEFSMSEAWRRIDTGFVTRESNLAKHGNVFAQHCSLLGLRSAVCFTSDAQKCHGKKIDEH